MVNPKLGMSKKGQEMHYSVGALIEKDGKYLLIDRANPPYGFAGIAGHIDEDESEVESLIREAREESGLKVVDYKLLFEEELDWNWCSKGVKTHYWYLFKCDVKGEISQNVRETKSIGWYSKKEIKDMKLEEVWKYWFKKLGMVLKL